MNAAGAKAHHKIHTHKLSMEKKSWSFTDGDAPSAFPQIRLLNIPDPERKEEIPTQIELNMSNGPPIEFKRIGRLLTSDLKWGKINRE